MSLALSRTRIFQRLPDGGYGCARAASRAAIPSARVVSGRPVICRRSDFQTQSFSNTYQSYATLQDTGKQTASIEEIQLKNEFEANRDIRDYLVKWQKRTPNVLDPVREPENMSSQWRGNMLNDNREADGASIDELHSEAEAVDFPNIGDEGEGIDEFLEPGDLVALHSTDGSLTFGIYVRSVQKQQQFYTERGKWRIGFHRDLDYVLKGFAEPEDMEPLLAYFPNAVAELSQELQSAIEGGVPRSLGAHLLESMSSFSNQILDFYRENSTRLDSIHELVADEVDSVGYTIEELAMEALDMEQEELNDVILFAVHRAATQNSFLIQNDRSFVFSDYYLVQPKRIARTLQTVTTWVHEHQEMLVRSTMGEDTPNLKDHPIQDFAQKARRLVQLSRKVRSPTKMANVGPTSQRFEPEQNENPLVYREVPTEKFNQFDRKIIEFLQLWCIPPRRMTAGSLRSSGSHIIRTTGMYGGMEVDAATAPLFLQELGVVSPWENMRLLDLALGLPGHGISSRNDKMLKEVRMESRRLQTEGMTDTMQDLRTDWGELPIYCVDDVDAQEIDDGVSLEPVPGSNDEFWLRVHVANPSAFISHDNVIMKYAAMRNQTLYTPERTYPMLPPALTHKNFSLAPGRPTLTFSARMNRQGEVLETDVRNGTAGNVIYITHDKLRTLFEPESPPQPPLTVGGTLTTQSTRENIQNTLTPSDEQTFHTMRDLMLAFRSAYRLKNGAMDFPFTPDTPVSISAGFAPFKPYNMRSTTTGKYILGDPIIQLRPQDNNPHEVPDLTKRNLISLLMNLACWVSGRWCAERNIPAVFDGTWYHPEYAPLTNTNMHEYGGESWLNIAAPRGISSSTPLHHTTLGLDAYVKSTSPLRRYSDLLAHYQIEAALRAAATNPSADLSGTLPYTHDSVETYLHRTRWLRTRIRDVSKASAQHWATHLLFRAFYFAECILPETFTCILHKPLSQTALVGTEYAQGYAGTITSLGVKCSVVFAEGSGVAEEIGEMGILSTVEARIREVDLGRGVVVMEGVKAGVGFTRVGEWA
ncbi:hypothetical protein SI65_06113 [Aspergillus cristatus]|uniref:RNB domain-containing protein n=1 Tax=Aspergillus cristatus TaxID=573508 RepID=A0A1E3BBA0_ASPCR|nr:hypothetical protein SI65_06113 [Aspergillus cristatus]